jgi:phage terminase small subunit
MLSHRRKIFCQVYIETGNATEAAIKAGYAKARAVDQASRLLKYPDVQNYIKQINEQIQADNAVTMTEIIEGLRAVAAIEDVRAARARVEALNSIARICGLYTPNQIITGNLDVEMIGDAIAQVWTDRHAETTDHNKSEKNSSS